MPRLVQERRALKLLAGFLILSGCATPRMRFLAGAGAGAIVAGTAATALSPNPESRGINALVFGLGGALLGGGIGLLLGDDETIPRSSSELKNREKLSTKTGSLLRPESVQLPEFLKERFQQPIIEESLEEDSVTEDGTLHAPHKTYRIIRPAELVPTPSNGGSHG